MMHTAKVIAGGLALLVVCLLIGRSFGGPTPAVGLATAVKVFVPLWFVAAGINMWVAVTKAGYSVADELPFFLVVFAVGGAARVVAVRATLGVSAVPSPSGRRATIDRPAPRGRNGIASPADLRHGSGPRARPVRVR